MKKVAKITLIILIAVSGIYAQKTSSWEELNAQIITLYQQGRYVEAIEVAEEALEVTKKTFGPDHPQVATSLNNLAELYRVQGRYAEAEPLYKRALLIMEKALGPDHLDVATVLENLAALYKEMGNEKDAKYLESRAQTIRSNTPR